MHVQRTKNKDEEDEEDEEDLSEGPIEAKNYIFKALACRQGIDEDEDEEDEDEDEEDEEAVCYRPLVGYL